MMLSEKPRSPVSEHRKVTKSAMEKKRRARINSSLTELKTILAGIMAYKDERFEKMEKADILEMTVNYVRELQNKSQGKDGHIHADMDNYRTGVNSCISEVIRYVTASDSCDTDTKTKLLDHLANRVNSISTTAKATLLHSPVKCQTSKMKSSNDSHNIESPQIPDMNNNVSTAQVSNQTSYLSVHTNLPNERLQSSTSPHMASPSYCTQSPVSVVNVPKQSPTNVIPISQSPSQVLTNVGQIQSQVLQNVPLTILVPANFCTTSNGTTCVIPLTLSNSGSETGIMINPNNSGGNIVANTSHAFDQCSKSQNNSVSVSPEIGDQNSESRQRILKSNGSLCVSSNIGQEIHNKSPIANGQKIGVNHYYCKEKEKGIERTETFGSFPIDNHVPKDTRLEVCVDTHNVSDKEDVQSVQENLRSPIIPYSTFSNQTLISRKASSPSLNSERNVWRPW